jgi:hypothetical protein
MDVNLTTKVVSFGSQTEIDGGSTSLEIDSTRVEELYGEDKTQFYPGDLVPVLAYLDPEFKFVDCKVSSGSIVEKGTVTRTVTETIAVATLYSVDEGGAPTLQHIPASSVSVDWYGDGPSFTTEDTTFKATGGHIPAIGEASYSTRPLSFEITPPSMSLSEDEVYKLLVVIYVEEV